MAIFVLTLMSSLAQCEEYWTTPVKIEEVGSFIVSGYYRVTAKFIGPIAKESGGPITGGCGPTDSENIVGSKSNSTATALPWLYQAPLLNAYNLGAKVKLYINSACNGLTGLELRGVKIIQD